MPSASRKTSPAGGEDGSNSAPPTVIRLASSSSAAPPVRVKPSEAAMRRKPRRFIASTPFHGQREFHALDGGQQIHLFGGRERAPRLYRPAAVDPAPQQNPLDGRH